MDRWDSSYCREGDVPPVLWIEKLWKRTLVPILLLPRHVFGILSQDSAIVVCRRNFD